MAQENPIYKFLKENNLTQKDEASFVNEYSNPDKAHELYGFMQENNLTQKDFDSFYGEYFKKKVPTEGSGQDSASGAPISTEPLRTFQAPDVPQIGTSGFGSNLTQPSSFGDIAASAAENVDEASSVQQNVNANMPYLQEQVTAGAIPTPLTPEAQQQYVQNELIPYVEKRAQEVEQFNASLDNIRQQNRAAGYFTDQDKEIFRQQRIAQIQDEMASASKNAGFLSRNLLQPASNFAQGFTQGAAEIGSSVLGIPRFANDIVASAINGIISLTGSDLRVGNWDETYGNTPLDQIQRYVSQASERQRELLDKKYGEGGTYEQFKKGNLNGAINLIAHGVGETVPIMGLYAMTGGAGAAAQTAAGTAVFGAGTYNDLRDSDIPDELKLANSLVSGFAEGFFEQVGTGWLFKSARNILQKQGKKAASEFLENSLEKTLKKAYEKYYVLAGPAGEIMTEGATMITQNFMDKITGVDPERGLLDGWQDTAILAAAASAPLSTPTAAIRSIRNKKARTEAEKLSQYNDGIIEAMESENLTVEEKAAMFERYQNNTQKINEYLDIERESRGHLTKRQQTLLEGIESRQSEIDALMANESMPEAAKSGLEEEAAKLQAQLDEIVAETPTPNLEDFSPAQQELIDEKTQRIQDIDVEIKRRRDEGTLNPLDEADLVLEQRQLEQDINDMVPEPSEAVQSTETPEQIETPTEEIEAVTEAETAPQEEQKNEAIEEPAPTVEQPTVEATNEAADEVVEPETTEAVSKQETKQKKKKESIGTSSNDVVSVPVSSITTDEESFQNRESLDEVRVNDIVSGFDENKMDPIVVYNDNGKTVVLSGHHRFAAYQAMGRDNIPARVFSGTRQEAIDFARDSNTLSKSETSLERAKRYRDLRQQGKSVSEINEMARIAHGSDATKIVNLSHLDPQGKATQTLSDFESSSDTDTKNKIEAIADWIGNVKKRHPELSRQQENEMFDYLMEKYSTRKRAGNITSRSQFFDIASALIDRLKRQGKFNDTARLNLNNSSGKSSIELEFDNALEEAKQAVTDARKLLDDKRKEAISRGLTPEQQDNVLKPLEDSLRVAIRDEQELRGQSGAVKEAVKSQTSLFDAIQESNINEYGQIERELQETLGETTTESTERAEGVVEDTESESVESPSAQQSSQALQSSYERLTEGMTPEQIEADPELVRMRDRVQELQQQEGGTQDAVQEREGQPEGEVATKAGDSLRSLADKIRQGKINKPSDLRNLRSSTLFDIAWDGAIETVATATETVADIADAIEAGVKHLRGTEWYKSLSEDSKKKAESAFRKEMGQEEQSEQPSESDSKKSKKTPTVSQLSENPSERRRRSNELATRIGRYKEKGTNFWRDVSMYAANRIMDGDINSARDLARELHLPETTELNKAFSDAKKRLEEGVEGYTTSAKNAETARKREQYGFDERIMPEREIQESVISDARDALEDGYDVGGLMARIEGGSGATSLETAILIQYAAANEAEMIRQAEEIERTKESHFSTVNVHIEARERAINNLLRAYNAMEKSGTVNARALSIRKASVVRDFSLASMIAERRKAIGSDVFPKSQLNEVEKKYRELLALNERIKKRNVELEEKNAELDAKLAIEQSKKKISERKTAKKPRAEQIKDIQERRKEVLSDIKQIWDSFKVSGFAYDPNMNSERNKQLGKALLSLLDTYIQEGIVGAEAIIDKMHEQLKTVIPGIERKQVMDAISGAYNDPRPQLTDLQRERRNFRSELDLLQQIENAERGVEREKNPRSKEIKNARLEELRERLKRLKESDTPMVSREEKKLATAKKMVQKRIEEVERRIKNKDFAPPVKDLIAEDPELKRLRKELKRKIFDFRVENKKYELERRNKGRKMLDMAVNIAGVPRALMATADFSAPLRQGIFVAASRPFMTARAAKEMFKFWNSKEYYNEWMADFRESDGYDLTKKAGLSITDTADNVEMAAREEDFMSNLVEKVPFFGETFNLNFDVKGRRFQIGDLHGRSERAYTGFLNKMRIDLFQRGTELLMNQGYNPNDDIAPFKALATYVNAATGRGPMPDSLKTSAAALSTLFFAPRLISSRLYLLGGGPLWHTPNVVRKMYLRDLASFIAFGGVALGLSILAGADVEDDPRSSDFGKIRFGDDRYDIWGGFTQYITLFARTAMKSTKSSTGRIHPLDGRGFMAQDRGDVLGRFVRSKLAPTTALGWSWYTGKNYMGETFDWGDELLNMSSPLVLQDIYESITEDKPLWEVAASGALMTFGVGFQSYNANSFLQKGVDNKIIDLLNDKKAAAIEPTEGRIQVYNVETGENETLRGEKMERYRKYWSDYLKSDLESNREEYSKYGPNTFDRKFTAIKQAATAYAKKQISGVTTADLTIRSENKTYRLTPEQVRIRLDLMKEYKERFGHKIYTSANKYERRGMSRDAALIEANKDFETEARSASRDDILKMFRRGDIELTEGLED